MRKTILAFLASIILVSCVSVPDVDPCITPYEEAVASAQEVVDNVKKYYISFHKENIWLLEEAENGLYCYEQYAHNMKEQNIEVDTSEWDNKITTIHKWLRDIHYEIAAEEKCLRDIHYTVNFEIVDCIDNDSSIVSRLEERPLGEYAILIREDQLRWAKPILAYQIACFVEFANISDLSKRVYVDNDYIVYLFNMNEEELNFLIRDDIKIIKNQIKKDGLNRPLN